jgi:putative ABC transport system ATP-binding protein
MSPRAQEAHDDLMSTTPLLLPEPSPAAPAPAPGSRAALVEARSLTRIWGRGSAAQVGIADVDLDLRRGELVALIGPSGSGKSTLGSLLAGIDQPTSGSLVVGGARIDRMRSDRLATWRGEHVGIVFQDFHLLPTLTALENVELAIELGAGRVGRRERRARARESLGRVGLDGLARKLPSQMSGGEQQRVGIARAMVREPALLVADEPTGSLDQANGHAVFELLTGLAHHGTTIVFITHDLTLANDADRVVAMIDGRIESITERGAR